MAAVVDVHRKWPRSARNEVSSVRVGKLTPGIDRVPVSGQDGRDGANWRHAGQHYDDVGQGKVLVALGSIAGHCTCGAFHYAAEYKTGFIGRAKWLRASGVWVVSAPHVS